METIGQRIRRLRKEQGISQRELGDRLAWGNTRLSMYERDERTPKIRQLDELSRALGCTVTELINGEKSNVEEVTFSTAFRLPVIAWEEIAQYPSHSEITNPQTEWVEIAKKLSDKAYALRVRGDAMEPTFPDGSIIVVEPERSPAHGSYVVAIPQPGSEATFKQLIKDGGQWYLKPVNARYPLVSLPSIDGVIGVVVEMIHRISFL